MAAQRIAITLEQCWHDVPGGTATSALESIRALEAHASLELIGVSARHRNPPAPTFRPTIPVAALNLPRNVLYESWHRLRRPRVQRATGPIDVIHVTGMAMPPKSAPMVVTVHDLAFVTEPEHFTPHGVRFFHRSIELAVRDADVVVCPSRATITDCVEYGFDQDRLRLVPWGIDAEPVGADAVAAARARHDLTKPYLFWNGTIEPRKNVGVLLDAFATLTAANETDVELVLAGPEGWNDELARLAGKAGDRVRRIGFVPTPELRALHAGAELFCFPSVREGFGLPVLEAMMQGAPVITSSGTATAEVVGHDGVAGLLVDPLDVDAVADAMAALLTDPARRETMGRAARARALTFNWERTAGLLVQAYHDAAASAR